MMTDRYLALLLMLACWSRPLAPLWGQPSPLAAAEAAAQAAVQRADFPAALAAQAQVVRLRQASGPASDYVAAAADLALGYYQHGLPAGGWRTLATVDTLAARFAQASGIARGDFFHNYGALLAQQGQPTAAERAYHQALHAYAAAPADTARHLAQANTWQVLSVFYARQDDLPAARAAAWHNLRLRQAFAPASRLLADAYSDLGHIYDYMERIDSAIWAYETALATYLPVTGPEFQSVGLVANNLGVLFGHLGDYRQELAYARQALTAWRGDSTTPPDQLALGHERLAACYDRIGDLDSGLDHLLRARDIRVAAFGPAHPETAMAYLLLGRHEGLARRAPDSCRHLLERAYALFPQEGPKAYLRGVTRSALAQHARQQGDYAEALRLYQADLASASPAQQAGIYINMGGVYRLQEQWQAALTCLRQAQARIDPDYPHAPTLWSGIGLMQARLGQAQAAIASHQQALSALAGGPPLAPGDPSAQATRLPATTEALTLLARKAQSLLILYETVRPEPAWLAAARATYAQAIDLVQRLQTQAQGTRQILTQESRPIFEGALRCTWLAYQQSGAVAEVQTALSLMAANQAASLRKHLQSSRAVIAAGLPDSLRQRLTRLDAEIAFLQEKLHRQALTASDPDDPRARYWRARLFDLTQAREGLLARIERDYPRYFDLKYAPPPADLFAQTQAGLAPDERLWVFFAGDSVLYACTLGEGSGRLFALPRARWAGPLAAFMACLPPQPGADTVTATTFAAVGVPLYEALLAPLLGDGPLPRHLRIIPDGPLSALPFALLPQRPLATGQRLYRDLACLGHETAISYGFAAGLWARGAASASPPGGPLAGFAPTYGDTGTAPSGRGLYDRQGPFQPLQFNQDEVRAIMAHWPGQAWLGPQATETMFREVAPRFPLLHLAMHALVDTADPLYSALVFAAPPEAGSDPGSGRADGLLHSYEVYNLDLPAELIVLSACNTGTGRYRPGEGALSLAQAFAYAGCQRQVVSRWPVDDAATRLLMEDFYARLAAGDAPAEALRQARLAYVTRFPQASPALWGAFMSFGGSPLAPPPARPRFLWAGAISLALLGLAAAAWFRRRNSRQFS